MDVREGLLYTKSHEWIKNRSLDLLGFMEKRWDINMGDEAIKLKLLNLDFEIYEMYNLCN